ncbi:MAG: retroviral-like aspartic protease family protein [Pacificimonas sp.]|nr:retroviral-like aspartic protease family protein [Pacificimonas sp.]
MIRFRAVAAAISAVMLTGMNTPEPPPPSDEDAMEVTLGQDRSNRMTVDVSVNGEGPYPFVIDTGAERTMITYELAADLGLEPDGEGLIHTISGVYPVPLYIVEELGVAGDGVVGLVAPAVSSGRLGAQGLLGLDSLQNSKILIDMKDQVMTIEPAAIRNNPERAYRRDRSVITIIARRLNGRMILTDAKLNGVNVKVVVDTGAQVTVANEPTRAALIRRARNLQDVELVDVMGNGLDGDMAYIKRLQIDKITMAGGRVVFSDAPVFAELGLDEEPAILLGMSMLRSFRNVEVDFPNRLVAFDLPYSRPTFEGMFATGCRASRINRNC